MKLISWNYFILNSPTNRTTSHRRSPVFLRNNRNTESPHYGFINGKTNKIDDFCYLCTQISILFTTN